MADNNKDIGIYCIINILNNKRYIGSSTNIYRRKKEHFFNLRKGTHFNCHLQASFKKYGEENFKFIILQRKIDKNLLFQYERNFIIAFNSLKEGYNQSLPNINGSPGFTEKTIEILRRASYKQHYGETTEEEYQKWLEEKNKPKRSREQVIKDVRDKLGLKFYGICKKTNKVIHKFNSLSEIEQILNTSENNVRRARNNPKNTVKGFHLIEVEKYDSSIDYRRIKKIVEKKGKFKGNPLKCINVETQEVLIFENKFKAVEELGLNLSGIAKVLYGTRKTHKGYKLELVKNV